MSRLGNDIGPIVWLSLVVTGTAVLVSSLIGVPLGACVGLSRRPIRRLIAPLVHTGMALPPVVVGLVLYLLLSRSGPLGSFGWLFTPRAMILAQTLLTLPFVVGITMTSVGAVPLDLLLQVRSLGAGPWQVRWTILREARAGVVLAVATALGRSLSEVGAVLILGGNIEGSTRVLTTAIVLETGKGNFAVALALSSILLTIALVLNVAILKASGRPFAGAIDP
jgi:tungstate transport system permease protein